MFIRYYFLFINTLLNVGVTLSQERMTCTKLRQLPEDELVGLPFEASASGFYLEFGRLSGSLNLTLKLSFRLGDFQVNTDRTGMCMYLFDSKIETWFKDSLLSLVMMKTDETIPVGMFIMGNKCLYSETRNRSAIGCAHYLLLRPMLENSIFSYSPLMKEFWMNLRDEDMFEKGWIQQLSIAAIYGSIPSPWVSNLSLSGLTQLSVFGNQWDNETIFLGYLPDVESLWLNDNNMEMLPDGLFENVPRISHVKLMRNKLKKLPHGLENVTNLDLSDQGSVLQITDEDISSLKNVKTLAINSEIEANFTSLFKLPNLNNLSCRGCYLKWIPELYNVTWFSETLKELDLGYNNLTSLPLETFETLKNLELLSLDNNMIQDFPCNALSSNNNLQYLNLSQNTITKIEQFCFSSLKNLMVLDLSWNKLAVVNNLVFEGLDQLIHLNLSHNNLNWIDNSALSPLVNLATLNISYNKLSDAPHLKDNHLDKLDLSNNNMIDATNLAKVKFIAYFDLSNNSIKALKFENVSVLNLSHNSMTNIPDEMWEYMKGVQTLDLGMNNFKCCHENFTILQRRFNNVQGIIRNLNTSDPLFCYPDTQSASVLLSTFDDQETLCFIEFWELAVFLAGPLGLLSVILIAATIIIYYYRFEFNYIKYLLKKKKTGHQKDESESCHCVYDAFVCYSSKDSKWVVRQLLSNTEKEPYKYRLCLHSRDFTLGASIDQNVTEALKKSRKVICVLTNDFLASKWCRWELSIATHKMFKEGRDYIILVELEKIKRRNLPTDLVYLMDSRTYLEWPENSEDQRGQERCWERLRDALGDSIVKRTGEEALQGTVTEL